MAKPFISSFSYHTEGITGLCKDYSGKYIATSSFDKHVVIYDVFNKKCINDIKMDDFINGIGLNNNVLCVGQDTSVVVKRVIDLSSEEIDLKNYLNSLDFYNNTIVTTHHDFTNVIDLERNEILNNISLQGDNQVIKINKTFDNIIGVASTNFHLYDIRMNKEIYKIDQSVNCVDFHENKIVFGGDKITVTDFRKLNEEYYGKKYFNKHTNEILSVNFSMTGHRIVSGSSDTTIRIENINSKNSQIYYNDRMGIVNGVSFSNCNSFIFSGSDDGSLRLWRSYPNAPSKNLSYQEKMSRLENDRLKNKFKDFKEIQRIRNHSFYKKNYKK
ncbi:SOF1 [Hepatospora eriocheir]|uniref:SOF1 n=1 Tax=Hepatospora eriocheir TaxID=1081669 RepID=A0A1X0QG32_9MICR|nr:SOF1 [Hepatospora eriocheir]